MKYVFALVASLVLASNANAGSIVAEVSDTVGLPGFSTVILSVQSDDGDSFRGIDATFTGALNQVQAAGFDTPFGNFNAFIPASAHQDSQFLFLGTETGLLSIGVAETANSLGGAISGLANLDTPLANPAPFVRLVVPTGSSIGSDIQVEISGDLGQPEPFSYAGTLDGLIVPEPTSLALLGLGLIGFVARRRS